MITRPILDLLSAISPAVAPQLVAPTQGGSQTQNLRFDAALLEAAKTVRDGSGEGVERPLAPKVEQALESLFNQLAQQPAAQVRQWASQPELLKPVVEALAQTHGLNAQETAEFKSIAPMATQALIQASDDSKAATVNVVKLDLPATYSGPQGRESGTTTDPAKTFEPQASAKSTFGETPKVDVPLKAVAGILETSIHFNEDARKEKTYSTLPQAAVWAGTLISTRTDSGSNVDSNLSLSTRSVEKTVEPVAVAPITVKVSSVQTLVSAEPSSTPVIAEVNQSPLSLQQPPQIAGTAGQTNLPGNNIPNSSVPAVVAQARQTEILSGSARVNNAADFEIQISAKSNQPSQRTNAEVSLDFKAAGPNTNNQAPAIQDGSLFVLNGDGTSQGVQQVSTKVSEAPVTSKAPVETLQAPVAAPSPAVLVTPLSTPIQATAGNLATATTGQPLPTETKNPSAVVPELVANITPLVADLGQGSLDSSKLVNGPSKPLSSNGSEPKTLENIAGFQALQRSSQNDAPKSGMAFGQETMRHLVNQVMRDLGVRDAAFTQVSNALAQATGKENSHLVIKLKPGSLGEVQVDLSVEGGKLTAKLIASTTEVRDAFVRDLPAFKANLEAQGLRIDQLSVAVRSETNLNQQSQNQGQAQPQNWELNQTLSQAAPEVANVLNAGTWASPALNDQLFSALA